MPSHPQYPIVLTQKKTISDNTLQLAFRFQQEAVFNYQAGQFVQLLFTHNDTAYKRSYSIANAPASFQTTQQLAVAVSLVDGGVASSWFRHIDVGESLALSGPFGVLTLPETIAGRLIFVGTGTGIAPYRAMIPQLTVLAEQGLPIQVLMGARCRTELIYAADFKELARTYPHVDYRVCLSREPDVIAEQGEYRGYVQQQFAALALQPEQDWIYLCGNPSMIDDTVTLLKAAEFPSKRIKREKYVFSGH